MEIRRAELRDIKAILDYMEDYHRSSNLSDVPFCKKSSAKIVEHYIRHRDCYPLIATDDTSVGGLLFGSLEPYFFNSKRHYATDLMFFARGYGGALWKRFKSWAFSNGADRIIMGVSSGNESADHLLEVLGMTKTGGMYVIRKERS
jgi:RimJ/RimL family protein N-acetyltransferase